jgi:hypothetical protein
MGAYYGLNMKHPPKRLMLEAKSLADSVIKRLWTHEGTNVTTGLSHS